MATAEKNTKTATKADKFEPSTELVAQGKPVKDLLATKKNVSMADVLRRASDGAALARRKVGEMVASGSKLPKPKGSMALEPSQLAALDRVVQLAANAPALPSTVRELEPHEITALVERFVAAKDAASILTSQTTAIRGAILNHLTMQGERLGTVTDETPRDKTGWALIEAKLEAPGVAEVLSVETQSGGAAITAEDVIALEEEGYISERDRLDSTKHVPVLDELGLFRLLTKRPWVAVKLAERASFTDPKVSLNKRKK